MSEFGDVLEAMNAAPRGFDMLLGEVANWSDMDVVRRSMERRSGSHQSAMLIASGAGPAPPERPITRLWFARDGRFRAEHFWGVNVFDGVDLWMEHSGQVTQRAPNEDPLSSLPCALLLRPSVLLGLAPFRILGHHRIAGHGALTLECSPPEQLRMHLVGIGLMGADRIRAAVDPRTGVVLRCQSWFEGQPAMEMVFEALEYDAPLIHDPFRYDVQPEAVVRTERDIRRQMLEKAGGDPTEVDLDDENVVNETMRRRGSMMPPSPVGSFVGGARPTSLADKHMAMGPLPDDVDAARAAVTDAVEHLTDLDEDDGLLNVQGGSNLGEAVQSAASRAGVDPRERANYEVDEVVFVRADEAVVAFRIMVPMMPGGFAQTGRVIKVGDRWLVERATVCNLLGMAGVECPPPPDEP
jgi:outer membrane lipoprotein-sorting protein